MVPPRRGTRPRGFCGVWLSPGLRLTARISHATASLAGRAQPRSEQLTPAFGVSPWGQPSLNSDPGPETVCSRTGLDLSAFRDMIVFMPRGSPVEHGLSEVNAALATDL